MTTYSLTEILMQWAVFVLSIIIIKQFTRFEMCDAIFSEHKTIFQAFIFIIYRVVLFALMLISLITMMIAIGYTLGYLGIYRM